MSFRVQITPITSTMISRAGVGFQTQELINGLKRDLEDEAQRVIREMQKYPGETKHARYRRTGVLQFKTLRATEGNRQSDEYVRTGHLGLAWDFNVKDNGGNLTLVFTNVAHDRPGNYYAGWVNGFQPADARGRYHQVPWHADAGWANFSDVLSKSDIKDAAQDTINDYLKNAGLM
jgi:hypothetical protein